MSVGEEGDPTVMGAPGGVTLVGVGDPTGILAGTSSGEEGEGDSAGTESLGGVAPGVGDDPTGTLVGTPSGEEEEGDSPGTGAVGGVPPGVIPVGDPTGTLAGSSSGEEEGDSTGTGALGGEAPGVPVESMGAPSGRDSTGAPEIVAPVGVAESAGSLAGASTGGD
jgi:hypothetical protein